MTTMPITRTPQTLDKTLNKETNVYEPITTISRTTTPTTTLIMAGTSTLLTVQTNLDQMKLADIFRAKGKLKILTKMNTNLSNLLCL